MVVKAGGRRPHQLCLEFPKAHPAAREGTPARGVPSAPPCPAPCMQGGPSPQSTWVQLQLHPDTVPSSWGPHQVPRETLLCPPPPRWLIPHGDTARPTPNRAPTTSPHGHIPSGTCHVPHIPIMSPQGLCHIPIPTGPPPYTPVTFPGGPCHVPARTLSSP